MNPYFHVVGIGEALFDCFPDGRKVLGGAPLNVAFHAHQLLGADGSGRVVACVGNDAEGRLIADHLNGSGGGPTALLGINAHYLTGTVIVTHRGDEVEYEIVRDVAWDFLRWSPDLGDCARSCHALSFGTLAQRSSISRETIRRFVAEARQAIRLFDVNMRQDFYSREVIETSCSLASIVKCNQAELPLIHRMFFGDDSVPSLAGQAERLRSRFDLDAWVLTRGKSGTQAMTRSGLFDAEPVSYPPGANADPVGAGDGCSAAILVGLLRKQAWEEILTLANRVGAWIASQPGATPELPETLKRLHSPEE